MLEERHEPVCDDWVMRTHSGASVIVRDGTLCAGGADAQLDRRPPRSRHLDHEISRLRAYCQREQTAGARDVRRPVGPMLRY